jgi:hypothetical protein
MRVGFNNFLRSSICDCLSARIKAMRRHIALQKHFVRNSCLFHFAQARQRRSPFDGGLWECVTRPRVALIAEPRHLVVSVLTV